ncbi:hypothetical protein [Spirillospora sp. NPDC047279]|uniref:hypothetical protein n=1 Tax=Spirillospora sp. NPDC047279 TaxID=3155478 RepID=UPI00340DCC9B
METFHPLHQQLIWHKGLSVTMRPADWEQLIQSLAGHDAQVRRRRWAPPARAKGVLVPLLRVFGADMSPDGMLGVTADLRGPDVQGKLSQQQKYPGRDRRVRSVTEWWSHDPWLRMRAELRDGGVVELSVTDRVRYRKIHKVNPRGKHKWKTKTKTVHRVTVSRKLPKDAVPRRPPTRPPGWIAVKVRGGPRTLIRTSAKIVATGDERALPDQILHVMTELFRWTPPGATRRTR